MNLNQQILYLFEQEETFEKAICQISEDIMKKIMKPEGLKVGSAEHHRYEIFDEFSLVEGPLRARYMHALHLYSLFERYSIKYSKHVSKKHNLLKIDDLKGNNNFTSIRIFYTKVFDIEFQDWKRIDDLRIFRNLVAHADGYLDFADNKQAQKLADSSDDVAFLSNNRIVCTRNFFRTSINAVLAFFDCVNTHTDGHDNDLEFNHRLRHEFLKFETSSA